jgi:hypothetical protein
MQPTVGTFQVRCEVADGLAPFEKVVHIRTTSGEWEEVAVPSTLVGRATLIASVVGTKNSDALIELPRESAAGRWRVWVPTTALIEDPA